MHLSVVVCSLLWTPLISGLFDLSEDKIKFELYERSETTPELAGLPDIPDSLLEDIWKEAEWTVEEQDQMAKRRSERSVSHYFKSKVSKEDVKRISKRVNEFQTAVHFLSKRGNLTREASEHIIATRSSPRPDFDPNILCRRRTSNCNTRSKFRTFDGTCNNVNDIFQGSIITRLARLLPPIYSDRVSQPRISVDGRSALPGARVVSTNLVPDVTNEDFVASHMTMAFGQFLDHDITSTPNREDLECCGNNHPDCLPIPIPNNDPQFSQFRIGCMNFQRSHAACGNGARDQVNQNSAFIDGSMIYGSTVTDSRNLRAFNGGRLAVSRNNRLPQDTNNRNCGDANNGFFCFLAGDDRVNENPGISVVHQLWNREHNRVAGVLSRINPGWNDETLYQEARRIVVAELQNVVYNEFLPVVLGSSVMNDFKIKLPNGGYSTYEPEVNPSALNSFATAAFRFGHSLIQNRFQMSTGGSFLLRDHFNSPVLLYQQDAEQLLLGLTDQSAQRMDESVAEAVSRFLFRANNAQFGLDLPAINIQRGRDHGLPSYNDFREFCQLPRITSFAGLRDAFKNPDQANRFSNIYRNVNDIDLWVAGINEKSVPGGIVGPTFACIIGIQFNRLMYGDRYFFTHSEQPGTFNAEQLANIRGRTLSTILCDATEINTIQGKAFLPPNRNSNPVVGCQTLPALNLNLFRG